MRFAVRVRGRCRVEVAAYGLADAEHRVEKELRSLWPEARTRVQEVRRGGGPDRIAEEFVVELRLEAPLEVDADDAAAARADAFRTGRARLEGSRYWKIAWESADVRADEGREGTG